MWMPSGGAGAVCAAGRGAERARRGHGAPRPRERPPRGRRGAGGCGGGRAQAEVGDARLGRRHRTGVLESPTSLQSKDADDGQRQSSAAFLTVGTSTGRMLTRFSRCRDCVVLPSYSHPAEVQFAIPTAFFCGRVRRCGRVQHTQRRWRATPASPLRALQMTPISTRPCGTRRALQPVGHVLCRHREPSFLVRGIHVQHS